jgi:transcriptional regulator of aroF, aroG, tyrA and aromatic amino acid transport
MIERASVLSDTDSIGVETIRSGPETAGHCNRSCTVTSEIDSKTLKNLVGCYEAAILVDTLNATSSIRKAARNLGLSHTALLKKIEKYQLNPGNKTNQWNKRIPL